MNKPHKHAAVIKAWADGAEIECRKLDSASLLARQWHSAMPSWQEDWEYRVKPQPHKWQKEMDAYAAGKAVQFRGIEGTGDWLTADGGLSHEDMYWDHPTYEYRIKPEQVVKQCRATLNEKSLGVYTISRESMNLKLTFEDDKLIKAEVL